MLTRRQERIMARLDSGKEDCANWRRAAEIDATVDELLALEKDVKPRPWHKSVIEGLSKTLKSYRGTRARVRKAWGTNGG